MRSKNITKFKKDVKDIFGEDLSVSGGMGESIENAIIIDESNPDVGVSLEYKTIKYLFTLRGLKEWELEEQTLIVKDNKYYDKLKYSYSEDQENFHSYYFDITSFYK